MSDRIYNHGDMANVPHFGTIIRRYTDNWGSHVTILSDDDSEPGYEYTVPASMIGDVFKGNGLTRIVTEAAYRAWHDTIAERYIARREAELTNLDRGHPRGEVT